MCFCASFCVEEETKKERFFEAYEKGARSTKDARASTKEALTERTFEYGRSIRECVAPYSSWKYSKKKKVRDEIVLKGRRLSSLLCYA